MASGNLPYPKLLENEIACVLARYRIRSACPNESVGHIDVSVPDRGGDGERRLPDIVRDIRVGTEIDQATVPGAGTSGLLASLRP